jgi:isochorismate synthase EntC
MAKFLLRSVLKLGLLLDIVKGIEALHPTPVTAGQLDLRANPEPTPRAILADKSEIVGRSYYNTLCGYVDANSRKR